MRRYRMTAAAAALVAASGGIAQGQERGDAPFLHTVPVNRAQPNEVRVMIPAQLHPEVSVSRELSAQPVHPWMMTVLLDGRGRRATGMWTYIDPFRRLHGDRGLDDDHSFVKAQRRFRSLTGVTTSDMARLSHRSHLTKPRASAANRALVIRPNADRVAEAPEVESPTRVYIPARQRGEEMRPPRRRELTPRERIASAE